MRSDRRRREADPPGAGGGGRGAQRRARRDPGRAGRRRAGVEAGADDAGGGGVADPHGRAQRLGGSGSRPRRAAFEADPVRAGEARDGAGGRRRRRGVSRWSASLPLGPPSAAPRRGGVRVGRGLQPVAVAYAVLGGPVPRELRAVCRSGSPPESASDLGRVAAAPLLVGPFAAAAHLANALRDFDADERLGLPEPCPGPRAGDRVPAGLGAGGRRSGSESERRCSSAARSRPWRSGSASSVSRPWPRASPARSASGAECSWRRCAGRRRGRWPPPDPCPKFVR